MEYTYDQIIASRMPLSEPGFESSNRVNYPGFLTESFAGSGRSSFLDLDLEAIIVKKVKEEIALLMDSQSMTQFRAISLKEAKVEIYNFLKKWLSEGKKNVNIFDISMSLRLPADQIGKVMSLLSKKGKIKEI